MDILRIYLIRKVAIPQYVVKLVTELEVIVIALLRCIVIV